MKSQIQTQSHSIINTISLLKTSKNPFGVFFILADLKDIFISIWEMVLNSIELNYSKEAKEQYKNIVIPIYKNKIKKKTICKAFLITKKNI